VQHERALLASTTVLIACTYLVTGDYAGAEPIARLTARDAYVFIGAPAALIVLWLVLAAASFASARLRRTPWWLSVIIAALCLGAIWNSTSITQDYVDTLLREPRYSCACPR